jgi:S1-C subfamily serine protease
MSSFEELSRDVARVVERAARSVVGVRGRWRGPSSGVAVAADRVVTADHVLEEDEGIRVELPEGTVAAEILGRDAATDLALLRVEGALSPVAWADAGGLATGELALVVARPSGAVRAQLTCLEAVGPAWRTPLGGSIDRRLLAPAEVFLGYSGSLLANARGEGIGLNTTGIRRGPGVVPAETLARVVGLLAEHGEVPRAYLGVAVHPVAPASGAARAGLVVLSVAAGSPAEAAGIAVGDLLLALRARPVGSPHALLGLLDAEQVGAELPIEVLRGGEARTLTVVLGRRGREG